MGGKSFSGETPFYMGGKQQRPLLFFAFGGEKPVQKLRFYSGIDGIRYFLISAPGLL
jgi:hypothetical protein